MAQEETEARRISTTRGTISVRAKVKHESETVGLRIERGLKQSLVQVAKRKGINLNTLASQVFSSYVYWGQYVEELRMIPFGREALKELFEGISTETIEVASKRAGEEFAREEILFIFKRIDLDTVLRYIELRSSHFPAYHHWIENGAHHFTVQHDLGPNFSLYAKGFIASMLRNTIGARADFVDVSRNSITYSITH